MPEKVSCHLAYLQRFHLIALIYLRWSSVKFIKISVFCILLSAKLE